MTDRNGDGTFAKGNVANPGGRTRKRRDLEEIAQELLKEDKGCRGLTLLLGFANDTDQATKDRTRAVEILMAYAYGKPRQRLEHSADPDTPMQVVILPAKDPK